MPDIVIYLVIPLVWVIPGFVGYGLWYLAEPEGLPWWAFERVLSLVFCALGPLGLLIGILLARRKTKAFKMRSA